MDGSRFHIWRGDGGGDFVEVYTAVSGPKNSEPARQQVLQQLSSPQQYLLSHEEIVAV